MSDNGKYIVWSRGYAEIYDTRDKAFATAYVISESDHNWVDYVEGPDGDEDLYDGAAYHEWERAYKAEQALVEQQNPSPKPTHRIFVKGPNGYWEVVEWVYPPDYKYAGQSLEVKRDRWIEAVGVDRVKVEEQ